MGFAYVIGQVSVKDAEKWAEYQQRVQDLRPLGLRAGAAGQTVSSPRRELPSPGGGCVAFSEPRGGQELVRLACLPGADPAAGRRLAV